MRFGYLLLLSLMLLGHSARASSFEHQPWDQLLHKHVIAGDNPAVTAVDYAGLLDEQAELDLYLEQLTAVSLDEFDHWSRAERLAFLINAYNAWTVRLVLSGYPEIDSIKELGTWFRSPWQKEFIPLLGTTRSLDDIEHGLIRGSANYQDPRIHFAVNCASIGCPALRAEAYTADRLEAQLDEQTRLFLADRNRNRLQDSVLKVSPLFKWYRDDFESGWLDFNSLNSFFSAYAQALGLSDADISRVRNGQIRIEYMDYDWTLNSAAPTMRQQAQ